jgi:transcriptional regulator with XRE-family HTH domain
VIEKALGKRIAELRKAKGFTQEQFAEKSGYSVEFVSLVERGVNAPAVAGLEKIAKVLGVEVKDLFDFRSRTK